MLGHNLRHAFPHLHVHHHHHHHKHHAPPQFVFSHPTEFHMKHNKHTHAKEIFHVEQTDPEHELYRILRCHDGFKVMDKNGEEVYRAIFNHSDKTMRIRDARNDNIVVTTRQRGHLFNIIQVFNGDGFFGKPFIEVCGALDYELKESETGRLLAKVEQLVKWSEPSSCTVHVAADLNVPLMLLLITSINHIADTAATTSA